METTIVRSFTFARHGQSEQNVIRPGKVPLSLEQIERFRSRDSGDHRLTAQGVEDGRNLGQLLRTLDIPFTLLAVSTFVRTQETLLATGLDGRIEVSPLIDERHSGVFETLLWSEAAMRYPTIAEDRQSKETRWRPQNGESLRDVLTRVLLFSEHLRRIEGGDQHVLIISHSRVMAAYMWWAEQLEDHEVPGVPSHERSEIQNGQVVQYGWAHDALRPTHKRVFALGKPIDRTWHALRPRGRYTLHDLRQVVNKYPTIL